MFDLPTLPLLLSNGLKTRVYDSSGTGEPIILLHGLALSIEIWGKVIPELTLNHRVIAFDFPGYGEADRPDAAYNSDFFVEQVVALMDTLEIERAHMVGSSMGGTTIVRLCVKHQHRLNHAVLMAPGGFGRETHPTLRLPTLPLVGYALGKPTWLSNAYALRLSMADPSLATKELIDLAAQYAKAPGSHKAFVRTIASGLNIFGVKDRESFADAARSIHRPTLILWGNQDRVFPVKQADTARNFIAGARLQRIDHCGHYPQWEVPVRFLSEISAFLQT